MTKNEAKKLMAVMTVSYPNYKIADIELTATTWANMLSGYTYEQVSAALKAYILSENTGFPPSIGQINEKLVALSQADTPTPLEAWSLVRIETAHIMLMTSLPSFHQLSSQQLETQGIWKNGRRDKQLSLRQLFTAIF